MASAALGAGSDMPCNSRTNPMVNTSLLTPVEMGRQSAVSRVFRAVPGVARSAAAEEREKLRVVQRGVDGGEDAGGAGGQIHGQAEVLIAGEGEPVSVGHR